MHAVIVRMQIKSEHVDAFERELKQHIASTRKNEPGCVQFDVAADKVTPRTYHMFEVYADDRALEAHAKSATLASLRARLPDWVEDRSYHTAALWPSMKA